MKAQPQNLRILHNLPIKMGFEGFAGNGAGIVAHEEREKLNYDETRQI